MKKKISLYLFLFFFIIQAFADKQPVAASVLVAGQGKNFESRYGHVDLVLHYKKKPSNNDPVLILGPKLKNGEGSSVFRYLGIGKKYPMGVWSSSFKDRLRSYLIGEDRDMYRYQLKLTKNELTQLARNFNYIKSKDTHPNPYSALFNNCSTLIADTIQSSRIVKGKKIRGWSKRKPLKLGQLLVKRGLVSYSESYNRASIQREYFLNHSKVKIDNFERAAVLSDNKYLRAFAIKRLSKKSYKLAKNLKLRELSFPSKIFLRQILKVPLRKYSRLESASFNRSNKQVVLAYNGDRILKQPIKLSRKLRGRPELAISQWEGGAEVYLFEVFK